MTQSLEALKDTFGPYFHQDWVDEFGTDEEATRTMINDVPKEDFDKTMAELKGLLSTNMSDLELRVIMTNEIGCYFDPSSKGQTYREWLGSVLKQLEAKAK